MAVTRKSRSILMTEVNDAVTGVIHYRSMTLTTSGGAAGDRLTITDQAGDTIIDYITQAAADSAELAFNENSCRGLTVTAIPTGTVQITVLLR